MANFSAHIEPLIEVEGGYRLINIAGDRGGRTYAGISERSNPKWEGWDLLTDSASLGYMIKAVHRRYKNNYWNPVKGDKIDNEDIAEILFSASVLSGPKRAIIMAQQCVEVTMDGAMGPNTLKAINNCDPELFEARFALARINRYRRICNRDRGQSKFLLGWLNRTYGELES